MFHVLLISHPLLRNRSSPSCPLCYMFLPCMTPPLCCVWGHRCTECCSSFMYNLNSLSFRSATICCDPVGSYMVKNRTVCKSFLGGSVCSCVAHHMWTCSEDNAYFHQHHVFRLHVCHAALFYVWASSLLNSLSGRHVHLLLRSCMGCSLPHCQPMGWCLLSTSISTSISHTNSIEFLTPIIFQFLFFRNLYLCSYRSAC